MELQSFRYATHALGALRRENVAASACTVGIPDFEILVQNKLQVGAQTIIEMKDKKLRIEDALNATKVLLHYLHTWYVSVCELKGPFVKHSFGYFRQLLRKEL